MTDEIQYNSHLREWKAARDYEQFCNDGILIENEWKVSAPKTMFLLKESNADFVDIIANQQGWEPRTGASRLFWRNINIWSYVISAHWDNITPSVADINCVKEKKVTKIAYVNVKKRAECKPKSDNIDIFKYAVNDKQYLIKQINEINPEVVVCCGTITSYKHLYGYEQIFNGVYRSENRLVLDFYHPSCRKTYVETFTELSHRLQQSKCVALINELRMLRNG